MLTVDKSICQIWVKMQIKEYFENRSYFVSLQNSVAMPSSSAFSSSAHTYPACSSSALLSSALLSSALSLEPSDESSTDVAVGLFQRETLPCKFHIQVLLNLFNKRKKKTT